jgi:flavodoxin I
MLQRTQPLVVRAGPQDAPLGIYYCTGTMTTQRLAFMLKAKLGDLADEPQEIRSAIPSEISEYHGTIFGAPAYMWEAGRVSALDMDQMEAPISNLKDLEGKKVAIFATGDQEGWPEHFADSASVVWDKLEMRGAELVGKTKAEGYTYKSSRASRDGVHLGLLLDEVTQKELTEARVDAWVEQLKEEFGLLLWSKP